MLDALVHSPFFGLTLSFVVWSIGGWVNRKTGVILLNQILVAVAFAVLFLNLAGISYEAYSVGGDFIKMLLGPATAVLALNIYDRRRELKEYFVPVLAGCFVGSLTSLGSVVLLCRLFGLEQSLTASLMPKSCTAAIAVGIAQSSGGIPGIAAGAVMIAGLTGAVFAPAFAKVFRVKDPVAEGVAIGACSHVLGTARAMEIGPVQAAMSSVSICLCGIMSSVLMLFF